MDKAYSSATTMIRRWFQAYAEWDERTFQRIRISPVTHAVIIVGVWVAVFLVATGLYGMRPDISRLYVMEIPAFFGVCLTIALRRKWSNERAERRLEAGECVHCGYDLRGTTTPNHSLQRCPECGRTSVTKVSPRQTPRIDTRRRVG